MAKRILSNKRAKLLATLEDLVGNECYNGSIQNWGPGGRFEGEGREFRYPTTFISRDGIKIKRRSAAIDLPSDVVRSGYYAFGANQLHIIKGLDRVIKHLESEYGLKI